MKNIEPAVKSQMDRIAKEAANLNGLSGAFFQLSGWIGDIVAQAEDGLAGTRKVDLNELEERAKARSEFFRKHPEENQLFETAMTTLRRAETLIRNKSYEEALNKTGQAFSVVKEVMNRKLYRLMELA